MCKNEGAGNATLLSKVVLLCRLDYKLEVMKNGQIMETREVSGRGSFTFGRTPGSDFVLEHPSASRLHAVLQYRGADGQAFLYDAGSAHGTFLNKKQIAAKTHVPLRCATCSPCADKSRWRSAVHAVQSADCQASLQVPIQPCPHAQPCLLSYLAAAECRLVCTSGTCLWWVGSASSLA